MKPLLIALILVVFYATNSFAWGLSFNFNFLEKTSKRIIVPAWSTDSTAFMWESKTLGLM